MYEPPDVTVTVIVLAKWRLEVLSVRNFKSVMQIKRKKISF